MEALKTQKDISLKADVTFGELLEIWKTKYLLNTVRENTKDFYGYMLRYIPEKMKNKKLSKITPVMIQTVLNSLLEKEERMADHYRPERYGVSEVR